ncbi:Ctf1 [Blastomyces gilchristii SLH14081]|uniref:Ctf1 n=1 Tax=Blastomyces gilchristii (strain SLH14081) TaxID=559298 RepID=A0A179UL36_BLAGS|nr:Ctf1 [Blastomyces gilchristii SLH14081]OAT08694.1 Ctf1 [Blastomyces gilchristii SLH14081]
MEASARSSPLNGVTRSGKPRQRSAIACQRCHARRVKCNAADSGIPCTNCERAQTSCQLIESKRGRKRVASSLPPSTSHTLPGIINNNTPSIHSKLPRLSHGSPIWSSLAGDGSLPEGPGLQLIPPHDRIRSGSEGPETLYAQVLENAGGSPERPSLVKPGGQVVYLGETFNLTYLLQETSKKSQPVPKRHVLLPLHPRMNPSSQGRNCDAVTMDLLQRQDAFSIPSVKICRELFRVYFKYVHKHYPILDRRDFACRYADPTNPPSFLLLQAVLFMGSGHCDVSVLKDAGFKSRYDARLALFKRTKALYDLDYESDKLTICQSLFLMSFWWNSPTDQKDTWHWLGNSISLALTIGMHRDTHNSDMSLRDQRLWKKIWWSLFTEDKHAAAALGRPVHIRLRDCDVEQLHESDFEEEPAPDPEIFGVQERVDILYVLFLSELSKIVERIIDKSFNAHDKTLAAQADTLQLCEEWLLDWERRLPPELHLSRSGECVWTGMLHIAHCWFRILTHRSRTPENPSSPSRSTSHQVAMNAANRMVRIIEEVLSSSAINQCPIHVIPALFAAMSMHTQHICSGDPVREQLGSVKIRLSMIALRELQSTWPVSGWIFLLFTKIIRRIRDTDDYPPANNNNTNINNTNNNNSSDGMTEAAVQAHTVGVGGGGGESGMPPPETPTHPHVQITPGGNVVGWDPHGISMPLNFSTDWSGVTDGDLCLDPEFDFMIGTPRTSTPRIPRPNFYNS